MARSNTALTANRGAAAGSPVANVPLTLACWFKPNNLTTNENLIFIHENNTGATHYIGLTYDGANTNGKGDNVVIAIAANAAGEGQGVSPTGGTAGAWMHCAAVFASATSRIAYLDGVGGTADTASKVLNTLNTGTGNGVDIGTINVGGAFFSPLDGAIAEVCIWDVALTAAEVASLAKGVSALLIRPANLVFYSPFGGRGTERDWIGNRAITISGTMAQTAHPPGLKAPQDAFVPVPDAGGGGAATAAGTTVTEQGSLVTGSATGAADRAGATVTLNASLIAGTATGAASVAATTVTIQEGLSTAGTATGAAARAGATVTEAASLLAGSAAGAATGAAATVSLNTSLISGSAVVAATAAGATLSLNTSLIAGAKSGAASAAGATISEAISLIAGTASGGGVGTASGATVTETAALSVGTGPGAIPAGFPTAATTGVRSGVTLTASGPFTVSTNNAVVSGLDILGSLRIEANNVTVQDCRITGGDFYGIIRPDGYTGLTVEHCTIIGFDSAILGAGTLRYNDISQTENGIVLGDASLVEHNYIHNLGTSNPDAHYDGIEINGAFTAATIIRHNTIVNPLEQTSAVMINNFYGAVPGVLVENNFLSGGGYTLYSDARFTADPITNVIVRNNVFRTGGYSYAAIFDNTVTWTGNIDAPTWRFVEADGTLGAAAPRATGEALAAGLTVTETASLIAGAASAGGAGTASGVTVSLAASLLAGTATGAAARAGVTVTQATSLLAGSASAAITAPGATVTATTSFIAGAKSGAAVASGATVTESASLVTGAAFGPGALAAVAPPVRASFDQTGAFWDSTSTTFDAESTRVFRPVGLALVPGVAVGGIGAVPGATLTAAFSLIPGSAASTTGAVPGKTLTAAHSFIAGAAIGNAASIAAGATITAVTAFVAGAAVGSGGTQAAVAPPPRRTFDRTNVRWDLTGVTFDEESSSVLPQASYTLVPGAAVVGNGAQGAILTSTVSLIAGAAIGSTAPIAAGKTLTTVTALLAGAASSTQPAMVTGATVGVSASLIAGAATGAVSTSAAITWDATSPTWDSTSVTFDQTTGSGAGTGAGNFIGQPTYSFIAGTAIGASSAAGVTFETRASFMASPANVQTGPGTAQGATVTTVLSLVPGTVRGTGWRRHPHGGPPWTNVDKPGGAWTVVPGPGGGWDRAA